MKKRGFVLLESIVVLVVVTLSLTLLLSTYSLITKKTEAKEYYDKTSDKYLLYSFSQFGTNKNYNYSKIVNSSNEYVYIIDRDSCSTIEDLSTIFIKPVSSGEEAACTSLFKKMNLENIYLINDIDGFLSCDLSSSSVECKTENSTNTSTVKNGAIEYIKTLEKCDTYNEENECEIKAKYMIGVFYRGGKYYYTSIKL